MSEYNSIGVFGGIAFKIADISASEQPSTLKTNLGKTYVEKDIPLRNAKDIILQVRGVIVGLSESTSVSKATAIENDRDSLIALDDGYKHTWTDGKHNNIQMVIEPNSLIWEDKADRATGMPYTFSFTLKEWK